MLQLLTGMRLVEIESRSLWRIFIIGFWVGLDWIDSIELVAN